MPMTRSARWAVLLVLYATPSGAQEGTRWQRNEPATVSPPTVFHATQGLNLPTAVTPGRGEFLFEIAHRFAPAISADDAFFGLDGPVRYRLALSYGVTDRLTAGLLRSNLDDNTEVGGKLRFAEWGGALPVQLAIAAGIAWNTEVGVPQGSTTQAHAEVIVNAALGDRIAIGVVPSLVTNPLVRVDGEEAAFAVGLHGQAYLSDQVSVVGEWVVSDASATLPNDPASFSLELETGGHFFRVGVTNSLRLNPAQHFVGAEAKFEPDEWRLAFNITRVLRF